MSKKLYFLISFVLVLSLSTLAQADAIWVTNPSFEFDVNCVNTVPGHTGYGALCGDWLENYPTGAEAPWVGVDVQCPDADSTHCHRWPGSDGGVVYSYIQAGGGNAYQVLDMNNSDANGVIVAGRKYTLTYDAMGWGSDEHTASLFYVENVSQPDVNHNELASETYSLVYIERDLGDCAGTSDLDGLDECPDWTYDLTVTFVAETGADCIGKTLGLKITTLTSVPGGGGYTFVDNFRLEWSWASSAYDPDPADEAEDVPMDVNLAWSPGLWAVNDVNGHEVYFGTSWADVEDANTANTALYPGVYRGSGVGVVSGPDGNGRYSYDVLEILQLGRPYYWRIDEVNENWASGPVQPVNGRWKGDVWSFRTIGYAYNVYPADGAEDIPSLNLTLLWTAGDGAGGHDVYFGSDEAAVEDANTTNTGLYPNVYRGTQPLSDVNYDVPENLDVSIDYFWRIDEVSGTLVTGDVWSFTTGVFILVDSFEPYRYVTTTDLTNIWKDPLNETLNNAQLSLFSVTTDVNMVYAGEQSMLFAYRCFEKSGAAWIGSWAAADMPTEVGTDWTVAGAKALVVNYYGDPCNAEEGRYFTAYAAINDQMYVELEDGSANTGIVKLPSMSGVKQASWSTWNISLQDPNFSGVDMNNVAKIYIGFGGDKTGQSKGGAGTKSGNFDTVWFDDIRLYPPRCMPEVTGLDVIHALGDFTGPFETEDCNTDYFDLGMMAEDWMKIDGDVLTKNSPGIMTEFVSDEPNWTTDCAVGTGALEVNNVEGDKIDISDPRLIGLTNMTITAWVKRDGPQQKHCGIVASREAPGGATELMGSIGKDQVGYGWNGDYWGWNSALTIPDQTWAFIAVAVEPTQATVYLHPISGTMSSATNVAEHEKLIHFFTNFRICRSNPDTKQFKGLIDDVRIYDWTLDEPNMEKLVHQTGEPNKWPVYWYKFDETSGTVAADSGYGTQIYSENVLPTNLVGKDPNESEDPNLGSGIFDPNNMDIINFRDYRKMADNWLMGPWMWPPAL